LADGRRYQLRQLYPDAEKTKLFAAPTGTFWQRGDLVSLPVPGAQALVVVIGPAPERIEQPTLLNALGRASLTDDKLELVDVLGEMGTERELRVALPVGRPIRSLSIAGTSPRFRQAAGVAALRVHF